jgi:hypothetical protein
VESGAGQTECNRVKGKPAYKELKGTGSEREQAEEAVGYYRTWQVSLSGAVSRAAAGGAPPRCLVVPLLPTGSPADEPGVFRLPWGTQATRAAVCGSNASILNHATAQMNHIHSTQPIGRLSISIQ